MTMFFLMLLTLVNSRKTSFIEKIYNDIQTFRNDFCTSNETLINSVNNDYSCTQPNKTFYKCKGKCNPVCVPQGRCMKRQHWQCYGQLYRQVKCVPDDMDTSFDACKCNYGFEGGQKYPCSCAPNKRILWSTRLEGEVCLSSTECMEYYHCKSAERCYIQPGHLSGTCVSNKL